jgi:hypothetical protein
MLNLRVHKIGIKKIMKIQELLKTLPNALHDARMQSIKIDYELRVIEIAVEIWMGTLDRVDRDLKEEYRSANLQVTDFEFCVVDVPDKNYPYSSTGKVNIDMGLGEPPNSEVKLPKHKDKNSLFWIWVNEWNAFIRIAAGDIVLSWVVP